MCHTTNRVAFWLVLVAIRTAHQNLYRFHVKLSDRSRSKGMNIYNGQHLLNTLLRCIELQIGNGSILINNLFDFFFFQISIRIVPILKAKWKGLRDMFRVEIKRIPRNDAGDHIIQPHEFDSKWTHYRSLLFLGKFYINRLQ